MEADVDREVQFRQVVRRCYRAAGLKLADHQVTSLARVYADWAQDADDGVVTRLERALAISLGLGVVWAAEQAHSATAL